MTEVSLLSRGTNSLNQFISVSTAREQKAISNLQNRRTSLNRKNSALLELKSILSELRTGLKGFTDVGADAKLAAKTATSSNEALFTVTADSTASSGVSTISIERIAKNDVAISDAFNASSNSIAEEFEGEGLSFNVQIGSGDKQEIAIDVDDEDETNESILGRIAEKFNSVVDDASATVVSSSKTKDRLTFTASETGSDNALTFSSSGDDDVLEELGLEQDDDDSDRTKATNSKGGFTTVDTEDLDAAVTINGIDITTSDNTIGDVIKGVTINLKKSGTEGEEETISVTSNANEIINQINGFIGNFNKAITFLNKETSINVTDNERGELAGNFSFRNLKSTLRIEANSQVSGLESGAPSVLSDIGIKINSDGTLLLDDEAKLEELIESDASEIIDIFTSDDGIAPALIDTVEDFVLTGTRIDDNVSSTNLQVKNVDTQIARLESRLSSRENSLRKQFTNLERTLASLNSQQTLLNSLSSNITNLFQQGNENSGLLNRFRIRI